MNDNLLEDLFKQDQETAFIDGDTFVNTETGTSVRLDGVDTDETPHVTEEGYKPGQVGGALQAYEISRLADKNNFSEVSLTGEQDIYGRYIGDKVNPVTGERLTTKLLQTGLADVTTFSSPEQITASLLGRLDQVNREVTGTENEWDKARKALQDYRNQSFQTVAKPVALNELQKSMAPEIYSTGSVQIGNVDRNLDNTAKSSLKTAWALGKSNLVEGLWGAWDLIGDEFGFDDSGKPNVERLQREVARMPVLENQMPFDEEGNWQLDSATKVLDSIITNAAMSAPYMITSILSVALAPATFGVSLTIPSTIYAGQVYNAQEEKDASAAIISGIAQGVLERLGLKGITKSGSNFINNAVDRNKIVKELADVKYKGNIQFAEKALAKELMTELVRVSSTAKNILATQFANKYLGFAKDTGKAFLKGGAAEALTETGQELFASLGEKSTLDITELDTNELTNRLMNAAVAGGTLGGIMSFSSQVKSNMNYLGALSANKAADPTKASMDMKDKQMFKEENSGKEMSVDDIIERINDNEDSLKELIELEYANGERPDTIAQGLKDLDKKSFSNTWRGLSRDLYIKYGNKSKSLKKLFALIGGTFWANGAADVDFQNRVENGLNEIIGPAETALAKFGVKSQKELTDIFSDRDIINLFNELKNKINYNPDAYYDFKSAFNSDEDFSFPDKYKDKQDLLFDYFQKINNYNNKISSITGEDFNLLQRKTFNKVKITNDMAGFVEALEESGMSAKDAEAIAYDILDIEALQETHNLFDGNLFNSPLKAKDVDINRLRGNPKLDPYLNDDLFYNMSAINGTTAAILTNSKYYGTNGKNLAYFIKEAYINDEITADEAAYLAAELKDYLDIRKGEYKKIENPTLKAFQSNVLFVSILNQLPLATLSSIVELALVPMGVPKEIIFGKGKNTITGFAKMAAAEFYDLFNEGAYKASRGLIKRSDTITDSVRENLWKQGWLQSKQSVAQKNDVNAGINKQRAIDSFFRLIGLQSLTNLTRNMRLSLATDAIHGYLYDVQNEGDVLTKQSLSSREELMLLGVDIDFMLSVLNQDGPLTREQQAKYDDTMSLAMFRFVNQAVAFPTKSNRPKFYQNPRTAIFFQFQGFIATFTSTILPRIYKSLFNGNTPLDQRMGMINTIATLLFLGFFTQYLRDLLKYGEETPYLDNFEQFRRGVNASGLLGTGERVINTVFPLYDSQSDNWVEFALDEISGQAPVLGYAGKLGDAAVSIFDEQDKAPGKILKAAPLVGPFNQLGWALNDIF